MILRQNDAPGQGYTLEIRPERWLSPAERRGSGGMQTLLQIAGQQGAVLPAMSICDEPDIENRGFYHDVTREEYRS